MVIFRYLAPTDPNLNTSVSRSYLHLPGSYLRLPGSYLHLPGSVTMAGEMWALAGTRIGLAIKRGSITELQDSLSAGENVTFQDRKGNTYLHYVSTMYRPYIFNILAASGININAQNRHGNTALHVTALHKECGHVSDLMAYGIDPFIKNRDRKIAAEIYPKGMFWQNIYDKYQPGIFGAVEEYDVERFKYLLHCWSRADAMRDGLTLRQFAAARKHHDLVLLLDQHRQTSDAIFGVLEVNHAKVEHATQSEKCNINYLNKASELTHILLHALRMKDLKMVQLVCRAGANVNLPITLHNYLKAPLYFAAISPRLPVDIIWTVLKSKPDFLLKDQRGRNAVVFALDKSNREVPLEIIQFMMQNGVYLADRDMTGITTRDVARLARRHDVTKLLDRMYIKLLREEEMLKLERLAQDGYDSMLINFNYRDTYIYACGNETDVVVQFVQKLPAFQLRAYQLRQGVKKEPVETIRRLIEDHPNPYMLANCKDKGGRSLLHLCVLHWRTDVMKYLLSLPYIDFDVQDNRFHTAYHYACAMKEEEREDFKTQLQQTGCDTDVLDCGCLTGQDYERMPHKAMDLDKERKMVYGMDKQLKCLDKYEQLRRIVRNKRRTLKDFKTAVRDFRHQVSSFSHLLAPVVDGYKDLVFLAVDCGQTDIAEYLVHLGADLKRKEKYIVGGEALADDTSSVSSPSLPESISPDTAVEPDSQELSQSSERFQQMELIATINSTQESNQEQVTDLGQDKDQGQESDLTSAERESAQTEMRNEAERQQPQEVDQTKQKADQKSQTKADQKEPQKENKVCQEPHGVDQNQGDLNADQVQTELHAKDQTQQDADQAHEQENVDTDKESDVLKKTVVRVEYLSVVERARQLGLEDLVKVMERKLDYYQRLLAAKSEDEEGEEEDDEDEDDDDESVSSASADDYDSDFSDSDTDFAE